MSKFAIGVDIGGSHICCSVVDLESMTIVEGSQAHRDVDNKARASEMLDAWTATICESIKKSGFKPRYVGMAFPGPFDYDRGISIIEGVNKFEGIFGLDVAQSMASRLRGEGITGIRFVNDASAFALGECMGGAARGVDEVVVLTLGTGFGSGFISKGKLVTSGDRVPANGWVYCLPFEGGIADDTFSTRWFCKRYNELTGKTVCGARDVADKVGTEPAAAQIFEEYGIRLAEFLAPVSERFGGQTVVLGGNISRAFNLFSGHLCAKLASLGCNVDVKPSMLRDKAAMIGAASLFV